MLRHLFVWNRLLCWFWNVFARYFRRYFALNFFQFVFKVSSLIHEEVCDKPESYQESKKSAHYSRKSPQWQLSFTIKQGWYAYRIGLVITFHTAARVPTLFVCLTIRIQRSIASECALIVSILEVVDALAIAASKNHNIISAFVVVFAAEWVVEASDEQVFSLSCAHHKQWCLKQICCFHFISDSIY